MTEPSKPSVSTYFVIGTAVIPQVTQVRLYEETYAHIAEHPEIGQILPHLPVMTDGLVKAISDPTHVEQSRPNAFVFVDETTTNAGGDPLRVPVKLIEGTSGLVKTAYFALTTGSAEIIWRRTDIA